MGNDIPSEVISYYQNLYPDAMITPATTYASLGLVGQDRVESITALEDNFGIPPDPHDAKGIYTIGQAIVLIEQKELEKPEDPAETV